MGQYRRLETMLHEDPLTGLFNRRYVLTRLAGLISGARRHGRPLSVAMIDIDHFKRVNDAHGHEAGDAALVSTTIALRDRMRAEDELGRLGGEEFLALLPDAGAEAAGVVAESLRAQRRERAHAHGGPRPGRHGQRRMGDVERRGGRRRAGQDGPTRRSSWPSDRAATPCGERRTSLLACPVAHDPDTRGQARGRQALRQGRAGHRRDRGPDRPAHAAHQRSHRAPADAQARPSLAPRAPDAGRVGAGGSSTTSRRRISSATAR